MLRNVASKVATGSALSVSNPSGGSALGLQVNEAQAPLTVNPEAGTATNLSADEVDGKDSADFYAADSKVDNSDELDGLDSTALGIRTEHNFSHSYECDTPTTFNQCGKVKVVVPPGKQYLVSVWSTMSWRGEANEQTILYCAAKDNGCITPFGPMNSVTVPANKTVSASSEGETLTLSPGTYTFNTLVLPEAQVANEYFTQVLTKVMVRDASVPQPAGVSVP